MCVCECVNNITCPTSRNGYMYDGEYTFMYSKYLCSVSVWTAYYHRIYINIYSSSYVSGHGKEWMNLSFSDVCMCVWLTLYRLHEYKFTRQHKCQALTEIEWISPPPVCVNMCVYTIALSYIKTWLLNIISTRPLQRLNESLLLRCVRII